MCLDMDKKKKKKKKKIRVFYLSLFSLQKKEKKNAWRKNSYTTCNFLKCYNILVIL